jgi:hypothetical protein
MMTIMTLSHRRVFSISGDKTRSFLQSIVSCDMNLLDKQTCIYGLMLTPQGKYLADLFITEHPECLIIDCPAESCEEIISRLKRYVLRANIAIEPVQATVISVLGEDITQTAMADITFVDPRSSRMGLRGYVSPERAGKVIFAPDDKAYHTQRFACGVIEDGLDDSYDLRPDTFFPLDVQLNEIGAISFTKGCYVGQEVTARMYHKATRKKGLYYLCSQGAGDSASPIFPPHGSPIMDKDSKRIGIMLGHQGNEGFALLALECDEMVYSKIDALKSYRAHMVYPPANFKNRE